jgi:DNA-binding transcriptional ArsR family regulator
MEENKKESNALAFQEKIEKSEGKSLKRDIYVESEVALRKIPYDETYFTSLEKKLEWFALSLCLINKNDERDGIIAVLYALIYGFMIKTPLSIQEIHEKARKIREINIKTVYYHVKRLKEKGLVKKMRNGYILGKGNENKLIGLIKEYFKEMAENIINSMENGLNSLEAEVKNSM